MKQVAIYIRVSTVRQADGVSLEVQYKDCLREAQRHDDWAIVVDPATSEDHFIDLDSGFEQERRWAYQRLLALARKKRIDVILVWRFDRLARDVDEAIPRYNELIRAGVKIISATQGEADALTHHIIAVIADNESRTISKRVIPAMAEARSQGKLVNRPPYGYAPVRRNGVSTADLVPEQATWVQQIFAWAYEGMSTYHISIKLDQLAVPTPRGGRSWQTSGTLRNILLNPFYTGFLRRVSSTSRFAMPYKFAADDQQLVRGLHPPLVTQEVFDRVQLNLHELTAMYTLADDDADRMMPMRGLLTCGMPGCTYRLHTSWGRDRPHVVSYRCHVQGHVLVTSTWLHPWIYACVVAIPLSAERMARVWNMTDEEQPDMALIQGKIAVHQQKLDTLVDLLLDDNATPSARASFQRKSQELHHALAELQQQLIAVQGPVSAPFVGDLQDLLTEFRDIAQVFEVANPAEINAVLRIFIKRVVCYRDRQPVIEWQQWVEKILAETEVTFPLAVKKRYPWADVATG